MSTSAIPFLDLKTPHHELEQELAAVFKQVCETAYFVGGPMVRQFEKEFAGFCTSEFCIALNSGTDAVRFACMAAGVRPGDVVFTVPNTFIATVEGISQAGAVAEFVEENGNTYSLDSEKLQNHIQNECYFDASAKRLFSRRWQRPVSAIVPVHLYGRPADMDPIIEIAREYNLMVVEDACQAHGARYFSKRENRWMTAGSIGDAAAFSFYPGKNLGAMGEGGAVTTNSAEIDRKVRMLRDHGQVEKYIHEIEGYNGRLDALQAGILSIKLKKLANWNEQRRACAHYYSERLRNVKKVVCTEEPEWAESVFHLYVVRVPERQNVQELMNGEKIGTGLHYPIPLHLQKAYIPLHYRTGDFPFTEKAAGEILSLPMFPGLTRDQQDRVVDVLKNAVGSS